MADDTAPRPLTLTTVDDVALDAEVALAEPIVADHTPASVVLAHPHPLQGGSMTVPVIAELFRQLPRRGISALRFDFRGVGRSGGEHDHGRGERRDLAAAVAAMAELRPDVPVVVCGWSFGADVALSITDETIGGWAAIAPPLAVLPLEELAGAAGTDPRPTLLLVPEHDQFRPPDGAREATLAWTSTRVEVVPGTDHFLVGRTGRLVESVAAFAGSVGGGSVGGGRP